ncbi:DUF4124 domain-containing protein [Stutzerimonas stutzeri]|uniref:DUF4124 domain-containing protein n=1 Tax=Stutzerimonas stutzeri TaxID=316 RepID=UPI001F20F9C2|nr:DUF4124 domain-containing protein [Stutzerimonas stutzeri]
MKMWVICTGLLLLANPAFSASVFRCIDTAGHVTFSQQGCPTDQSSERQQAVNPKPSSDETVRMATTASTTNHGRKVGNDVAVVAEKDDGCGNRVTGSERRSAIISKSIRAGMTRSDVESALGRPESTTSTNGRDRLRFRDGKGQVRTVSFDEHGCVLGKR